MVFSFVNSGNAMSRIASKKSDICSLLKLHRGWIRPLKKVEKKWGIPAHVQLATIWKESSFTRNARTSRKKIFGFIPGQLRGTRKPWMERGESIKKVMVSDLLVGQILDIR